MKEDNNRGIDMANKLSDLEKAFAANQISESDYLMWKRVYSEKGGKDHNGRINKKASLKNWQK